MANYLFGSFSNLSVSRYSRAILKTLLIVGSICASSALAAPPNAFTYPARMVTGTNAVLNGMATPNGVPTVAWFEWGPTASYGSRSASVSLGSGTGVVYVTNKIEGLNPTQAYHYRLVTCNKLGIAYGLDQIFGVAKSLWNVSSDFSQPIAGSSNLVSVFSGAYSSLGLRADGTLVDIDILSNIGATPFDLTNVVAAAVGYDHSLALKSDGTVVSWGYNDFGQTNVPTDLSNVVAVAAGFRFSIALKADGTLAIWGNLSWFSPSSFDLTNVVSIAAQENQSVALKSDGTVAPLSNYAISPNDLNLNHVVVIVQGPLYLMAILDDGTVADWGFINPIGTRQSWSNAVGVAGGFRTMVALKRDGTVAVQELYQENAYCLSNAIQVAALNSSFMALAVNNAPSATPIEITAIPNEDVCISLSGTDLEGDLVSHRITKLPQSGRLYQYSDGVKGSAIESVGTIVLDAMGRVILAPPTGGWSQPSVSFSYKADDGALDSSEAKVEATIVRKPFATTLKATSITGTNAALNGMATAGSSPATVWFQWGTSGDFGNCTPAVHLDAGPNVKLVQHAISELSSTQIYHFRLVVSNKAGVCFGNHQIFGKGANTWGFGIMTDVQNDIPLDLGIVPDAENPPRLLSDADYRVSVEPIQYDAPIRSNVVAVAATRLGILTLKDDGTLSFTNCWGFGPFYMPENLTNVIAIDAGYEHCMALKADGTVAAWVPSMPVPSIPWDYAYPYASGAATLNNVVGIAAGAYHCLAVKNDGSVVAWGANRFGETDVPAGLTDVVAVSGGYDYSLALKKDGTIQAWGDYGLPAPTLLTGASNVVSIASGDYHNLALKADGTVLYWGWPFTPQDSLFSELTNAVGILANEFQSVVIAMNTPPILAPQTVSGIPNSDLCVSLPTNDAEGDSLAYRVIGLPARGSLFQYDNGQKGAPITTNNTPVTDAFGRLIFVPAPNEWGQTYSSFEVTADDGKLGASSATITVNILGAPFSATQPATLVTGNSVVLNGMATPGAGPASAWFEWGTNAAFGNKTEELLLDPGANVVLLTNQLSELSPTQSYHFRLVVSNSYGVAYGSDQVFGVGKRVWDFRVMPTGISAANALDSSNVTALAVGYGIVTLDAQGELSSVDFYGSDAPEDISNAVAISTEKYTGLAVRSDHTMAVWGGNFSPDLTNVLARATNIVAVSAGTSHHLGLRADGSVLAWAADFSRELGVPHGLVNITAVSAGALGNLALKNDGTVLTWNGNVPGQAAADTGLKDVVAISAGSRQHLALKRNGTVVAWNIDGVLQTNVPSGLSNVVAIAAGEWQNLALKSDGTVTIWQSWFGPGPTNSIPSLSNVIAIAAGPSRSAILSMSAPPAILWPPSSQTVALGGDVFLSVNAAGDELCFQWQHNGVDIPDTTGSILHRGNVTPEDAGNYRVLVSNSEGSALSDPAVLRVDSAPPTVTIKAPGNQAQVFNPRFTARGTAQDNVGIARVDYQLNDSPWYVASGTTNWSVRLTLQKGTNILRVKAVDTVGNCSAQKQTTFTLNIAVTNQLTILTNGRGSVTPNLNGRWLELGRIYTLTNKPAPGWTFYNWTGDVTSSAPVLRFTMEPGITIVANFVTNAFLARKGVYNGLFYDDPPQPQSSGHFTLTLASNGVFTGKLTQGTATHVFDGKFNACGQSLVSIPRAGKNPLSLSLQLEMTNLTDTITGIVSDGTWTASAYADKTAFSLSRPTSLAGKYNLIIPGIENSSDIPSGSGYARVVVDQSGSVGLFASLADGTTNLTMNSAVSKHGQWPLYVSLHNGNGMLLSWVTLTNNGPTNEILWIKPSSTRQYYPAGFATTAELNWSAYRKPTKDQPRALNLTNAMIVWSGGNLLEPITNTLLLRTNNTIDWGAATNAKATINLTNGTFSGTFWHPALGKRVPFTGVLMQNQSGAEGYFLGTNQSGKVSLEKR